MVDVSPLERRVIEHSGPLSCFDPLFLLCLTHGEKDLTTLIVKSKFNKAFSDSHSVESGLECTNNRDIKSYFDFLKNSGIRQSAGSLSLISNRIIFSLGDITLNQTGHQATFGGRLYDGLSAADLFIADVLFKGDLESETLANASWVVLSDIESSSTSLNHSHKLLFQADKFIRRLATMNTCPEFILNPSSSVSFSKKEVVGPPVH
ncbi:hypothetical protein ACTXT7_008877 [Hymenolepis weldensis]